jgi:hypothetical protein
MVVYHVSVRVYQAIVHPLVGYDKQYVEYLYNREKKRSGVFLASTSIK